MNWALHHTDDDVEPEIAKDLLDGDDESDEEEEEEEVMGEEETF